MPDPPSGHPYRVSKRGRNIYARHPDILDAIPAPIARLPDKAGRRWGGRHLDHGSGRGNADDDTNAGEARNGGQRQSRGAKKGKDRSCAHGKFLGSCPSFCRVTTYRWERVRCLDRRQEVPLFCAPRRSRQSHALFTKGKTVVQCPTNGSLKELTFVNSAGRYRSPGVSGMQPLKGASHPHPCFSHYCLRRTACRTGIRPAGGHDNSAAERYPRHIKPAGRHEGDARHAGKASSIARGIGL